MATNTATATTTDGQTVTVFVEPVPPSEANLADLAALWGLFFIAALVIFLARRLMDLFRVDHND